ncbi:MAG TPA: preprotein translocase subunit YajC [Synergistaceae bacterium]|uniref:preprotein translocase subunit YajC n=1 Tax=Synergistaceae TaxID=649777 RepID=UPI000ECB9E80|nr:preprotein translocase subunit YajC [Synergistaceae bacterium DZ-S4]HAH70131.1 preprotein translocase subunit YajC [Synergistaceae bacterium]
MGGQQGGLVGMMLPLAMFAAIFYFMIIRPQKKKQKAHEEMLASISRGSTIITAGGFFGIVREILDDSYIIELDEGVKARILKSSVSMKKTDGSSDARPKKKKVKKDEIPAETAEEPVKETAVVEAEAEESKDTEKEEA